MNEKRGEFLALAEQYRRRLELCLRLEGKQSFLRQRMAQLRAQHDPRTRAIIPIVNEQLRQLGDRLWQEQGKLALSAKCLAAEIAKLRDERSAQILRCRYLELMPWNDISDLTGVGVRWLHRLHNKALERLG
ncbi:MAG: hypothetical protein RR049_00255 [Angelakisella sp.]